MQDCILPTLDQKTIRQLLVLAINISYLKKFFENRSVFKAVGEKIEEIPMIHQSRALKGIDLPAVSFPCDVLSRTTHPKGTFILPKESRFFE